MKYRQIVFDVDGTLLNTEYSILRSLQDTIKTLAGTVILLDELTFSLGIPGEDALKRLHIADIPSTLALWDENAGKYGDTVRLFEGIPELLESLAELGYDLGIVTSRTKEELAYGFSQVPIETYFKTTICADDTTDHKPSAEPLLRYMEVSNASSGELLYIGDSIYDRKCAGNAEVDFALALWGAPAKDIQADYYLEKPSDLLSILSQTGR